MFLLDGFNIDLMHYNEYKPTNNFLDLIASASYLPYIIQPGQYTSHSRTLIDNIFINVILKDIISAILQLKFQTTYPNF